MCTDKDGNFFVEALKFLSNNEGAENDLDLLNVLNCYDFAQSKCRDLVGANLYIVAKLSGVQFREEMFYFGIDARLSEEVVAGIYEVTAKMPDFDNGRMAKTTEIYKIENIKLGDRFWIDADTTRTIRGDLLIARDQMQVNMACKSCKLCTPRGVDVLSWVPRPRGVPPFSWV